MGLNGIDISSWQDDLVVSAMTTCDFVIVKATGGAGYTNECFKRHADQTLAAGKLLGCYHYARDRGYEGSAEAEADHFRYREQDFTRPRSEGERQVSFLPDEHGGA